MLDFYQLDNFNNVDLGKPSFIIESLIPFAGEPCIIFGNPGAGKSWICNNLMKSIADGTPFLGKFKAKEGRIVYCSFDMPPQLLQFRTQLIEQSIVNTHNVGIVAAEARINIMSVKKDAKWVEDILEFEPTAIIFDTLRKIIIADESAAQTVSDTYSKLQYLFPGITPVLIHHQRKQTQFDSKDRADQRVSGYYSWVSDSDCGIQLTKDARKKPTHFIVTFPRLRYVDELSPISTVLDINKGMLKPFVDARGRALQLAAAHPTMTRAELVEMLVDENLCQKTKAYKLADEVLV